MSHHNITPNITDRNSDSETYDCVSCKLTDAIPSESLFRWKHFTNNNVYRVQGTCMFCGSTLTLWYEDQHGNRITK